MFEHSVMKRVSNQISDPKRNPFDREDPSVVQKLREVAQAFVQLQDKRHVADYDNSTVWTQTAAFEEVSTAARAFDTWRSIRHEKIAQDYLVSLLIKPRD